MFSNATFHWSKDDTRLLSNAGRALRVGGRIRFNFAGEGNCSHFFSVIREATAAREFAAHYAGFEWPWYTPSVEEYSALMDASGMAEVRVWGENADRYFPGAPAVIKWLDQPSLAPFLAQLPEGPKSRLREYVIKRMVEETQHDDGRCFETFRCINVSERKGVSGT